MFHRATQAGLGGKEIDAWELGLADLEIFVFGNKGDFSLERDRLAIQCGFLGNFQVYECRVVPANVNIPLRFLNLGRCQRNSGVAQRACGL